MSLERRHYWARTTSDITNIQQIMMMVFQMIIPAPLICLASIVLTGAISWRFVWIPIVSNCAIFTCFASCYQKGYYL